MGLLKKGAYSHNQMTRTYMIGIQFLKDKSGIGIIVNNSRDYTVMSGV